jgi:hypothetical protein
VFVREQRTLCRPFYPNCRIIPANAGFSFIVVKAAAVVLDLRAVDEHTETTPASLCCHVPLEHCE